MAPRDVKRPCVRTTEGRCRATDNAENVKVTRPFARSSRAERVFPAVIIHKPYPDTRMCARIGHSYRFRTGMYVCMRGADRYIGLTRLARHARPAPRDKLAATAFYGTATPRVPFAGAHAWVCIGAEGGGEGRDSRRFLERPIIAALPSTRPRNLPRCQRG